MNGTNIYIAANMGL